VDSARNSKARPAKVTYESAVIRCLAGDGVIRVEVWKDVKGKVARYNLAFMNFHLFAKTTGGCSATIQRTVPCTVISQGLSSRSKTLLMM